jgi:hypothetical protein
MFVIANIITGVAVMHTAYLFPMVFQVIGFLFVQSILAVFIAVFLFVKFKHK